MWLTSNEVPWDPSIFEEESEITIPACWDGESKFREATSNGVQAHEENIQFEAYALQNGRAAIFFVQTLHLLLGGNVLYQVCKNIVKKAASASSALQERNYEQLRPYFGWMPLEVIRRTFDCTTQLAMGSLLRLPFRQHHKSRTPQLNVPRLMETFATDTLFSSETGLGGITCAQLFVGTKSKLIKIFGMRTESEGPDAFEDFIRGKGALYALRSDNAKMQTGVNFKKNVYLKHKITCLLLNIFIK